MVYTNVRLQMEADGRIRELTNPIKMEVGAFLVHLTAYIRALDAETGRRHTAAKFANMMQRGYMLFKQPL